MRPRQISLTAEITVTRARSAAWHMLTESGMSFTIPLMPPTSLRIDVVLHRRIGSRHLGLDLTTKDLEHGNTGERNEHENDDVLHRADAALLASHIQLLEKRPRHVLPPTGG